MADNTTLNTMSGGDVVADEDIAGVKYQRVKLVDGTAASTALIGGDATNGLDVDVTRVQGSVAVTNAGLTELAGAINGSAQLDVNIAATAATLTVGSHAVTNAGTFAVQEASAAAIAASASVLDDWDESDRAKVNPIAGQAGVQGASGTVSALTQRVVLATDVALPAGTNAIGKLAANSGVDIGDVDVLSSALPTGASTAAAQATIVGHLDGVEGLLTTIDADTGTLAGAVSGTEMQVDVLTMPTVTVNAHAVTNAGTFAVQVSSLPATPAGSNNIGDVDVLTLPALVAGSANIGDVDVASIAAGDNNIGNVDVVSLPALPAGNNNIGDIDINFIATGTTKIGYIGEAPGATVVTAQVTPTASAATLVASRAARTRLTVRNGTNMVVFVGPATVSAANGFAMNPGDAMELDTTALLQNIVATVTGLTGVMYVLETAA